MSGAAPRPAAAVADAASIRPADASLLALVDRLTALLERSDLGELEVASGGTTIILRSPSAIERQVAVTAGPDPGGRRHRCRARLPRPPVRPPPPTRTSRSRPCWPR